MVGSSASVVKAANEYFDTLVKSRFIEMFKPFMNEGHLCMLEKLTNLFTDGNWIESKDQSQSGIRLIQTGNIGNAQYLDKAERSRFIDEETFVRLKCTEVVPGDVLVSRLPDPIGRSCIVPTDLGTMITGVDCTIIRFTDKINPVFFITYTLTDQYKSQIIEFEAGSTRKRISRKNLGKILVPVPPIELQNQFADFVKQVDKSKLLFQQMVSKYDELVKSRFNELIHLNPHLYELGDLISIYSTQRCDNDVYPILSITKEDGVVLQNEKFKKRIASIDVSSYKIVPRGKLIQGIHIDERNFAIQDLVDYGVVSPAYKVYSIKEELVEPVVLEYYLRSNEANAYIRNKFRGSIKRRESITKEDLFKMPILLPELSVQSEIVKFVVQVDKSKSEILEGIKRLKLQQIAEQ